MKSYNEVFEKSKKDYLKLNTEFNFSSFRDTPGPYQFLTAAGKERWSPDQEALDIAANINNELAKKYTDIKKPSVGYSNNNSYVSIDAIDSRHIMMSTFIFHHLGTNIEKIVEIGGGFGNWARLNSEVVNFSSWEIIDLDFVIPLQQWFLKNTVSNCNKIIFLDASKKNKIKFRDLCIGAHSLSELDLEIFNNYLDTILINSKFIFYSTHKSLPSKELVDIKLKILANKFLIVDQFESEKGKVLNILYKNKNYE